MRDSIGGGEILLEIGAGYKEDGLGLTRYTSAKMEYSGRSAVHCRLQIENCIL